jgi:hypothetical protein
MVHKRHWARIVSNGWKFGKIIKGKIILTAETFPMFTSPLWVVSCMYRKHFRSAQVNHLPEKRPSGINPVMTAPVENELHRAILNEREKHAKLNPDQLIDWDEAKKRIRDRTAK